MSPNLSAVTLRLTRGCALTGFLIGLAGWLGWMLDVTALKQIHPALVPMKANTALGLMAAAAALVLLERETVKGARRALGSGLGWLIAVLGGITLLQYGLGRDLGIDLLFFDETQEQAGRSVPGRMGVASATVFVCLGLGLALIDRKIWGKYRASRLAIGAIVSTSFVTLYYFFGIQEGESIMRWLTIALHTVVAFYALAVGLCLARPDRGWVKALFSRKLGGVAARRMLPAALVLPILLGWLTTLGRTAGWFGPGFAMAALVVLIILALLGLIWWTVRSINRQETEVLRAKEELAKSEATLRDFVDHATIGLQWVGPDGRIVWANQAQLDLMGYSREEYLGMRCADLHVDPAGFERCLERLVQGESVREFDAVMIRKDGERREVLMDSNGRFQDGKFLHSRCFTRDVTASRMGEAAQARLAAIVDSSDVAIVGKDLQGVITSWNKGAENVFGYTAEEAVGRPMVMLMPGERQEEESEILARIARGERVGAFESVRVRKDGAEIYISATVSPIKDRDGRVIGASKVAQDITARKRAELSLRDSEERYRNLFDTLMEGYCMLEMRMEEDRVVDCCFMETNQAFESQSGLREAQGRWLSEVLPDLEPDWLEVFSSVVRTGEPVSFEKSARGLGRMFEVRAHRIGGGASRLVGVVFNDVTEKRRAETLQQQHAALFARLVEQAPTGMYVVDASFRLQQVNALAQPVFARIQPLIGRGLEEVMGILWGPEVGRKCTEIFRHTMMTGERTVHQGFSGWRFDVKEEQWLDWETQRVTLADGTHGVVCYFSDVTETRRAARVLRESEERARLATEATGVGIWEWNTRTGMLRWDAQMFRMYGLTPSPDGLVAYEDWRRRVMPEDLAEQERILNETVASGNRSFREFRIHRQEDGQCRYIQSVETVRADTEGRTVWVVGTNLDITERKQAEADLLESHAKVQAASRAKDDFLAALSHELRTPLTPVLMTATALEHDASLSDEVRETLGMMRRNIELEARLIDDLLDLTRISRGKLKIAQEPADLHQLLEHTAEIVRSDTFGKQVNIAFHPDAARSHALADPTRLQQVFWNLIKNALKFTPTGGHIIVRTSNVDGPEWVTVTVQDDGIGIPESALPHIFNAFEQGDVSGQHRYGGLGLGLAISRAVMDAHEGGSLSAASEGTGKGALFTVRLPTIEAPAVSVRTDAASVPPLPGLRLLIVEDHETTRTVLAQLLTNRGHLVTTASTLQEGLAAFARDHFDIVISDLGLPDGSGLDLMREITRQRPVPAIALSGYGMEEDLRLTREAGFAAHLVKPVSIMQLRHLIDQITGGGKSGEAKPEEA